MRLVASRRRQTAVESAILPGAAAERSVSRNRTSSMCASQPNAYSAIVMALTMRGTAHAPRRSATGPPRASARRATPIPIRETAVLGFIAVYPGATLVRSGYPSAHPTRTRTLVTVTNAPASSPAR
jgi:hypothetical protein